MIAIEGHFEAITVDGVLEVLTEESETMNQDININNSAGSYHAYSMGTMKQLSIFVFFSDRIPARRMTFRRVAIVNTVVGVVVVCHLAHHFWEDDVPLVPSQ
jgi:hypothetical protein